MRITACFDVSSTGWLWEVDIELPGMPRVGDVIAYAEPLHTPDDLTWQSTRWRVDEVVWHVDGSPPWLAAVFEEGEDDQGREVSAEDIAKRYPARATT